MSSEKKKKGGPQSPSIADEEWEFSALSPTDPNLQTIISYEYLRSSPLRDVIVEWQSRSCGESGFARAPFFWIGVARAAELIFFPDRSPLGRLHALLDQVQKGSLPVSQRQRNTESLKAVLPEAEKQMKNLVWPTTIREAIRRIFKLHTTNPPIPGRISDIEIYQALEALEKDVPTEVKQKHAERICVRFDRFPEPWLKLLKESGAAGLNRRCALSGRPRPAVLESPRETAGLWFPPNKPQYVTPGLACHAFDVDWTRKASEIREGFSEWVNARHPEAQAGAHRLPEWLTRLSLYRLRRVGGLKVAEAKAAILERMKGKADGDGIIVSSGGSPQTWCNQVSRVATDLMGDFITQLRGEMIPSEHLVAKVATGSIRIV